MDEDERRIYSILGDDNARTMHNAARYRDYLLKHLSMPIIVTGAEDFPSTWQALGRLMQMSPAHYLCNCGPLSTPGDALYDRWNQAAR
jgi:hypothetical protein